MSKHKTLGQVYTPPWIVNEILDSVGYCGDAVLNRYIFEPASGDGAFLLEIVSRYIDACQNKGFPSNDIIKQLEKYIYAVEIDEEAHHQSITQLNQLVLARLQIEANLQWKVYNQDTVVFFKNHIGFFDFVVGNPPYIRIHNLSQQAREVLKREFLFTTGTIDIYVSFFELGLRVLRPNGILGYITPNSYLHNTSYRSFREYLKNQKLLKTLVDFKANKIFKGFSTYTAITVLQSNMHGSFEYKEFVDNAVVTVNQIALDALNARDWSFANESDSQFLNNLTIDKQGRIKDFFDVQYGFATLRDKIFIAQATPNGDNLILFNGVLVERDLFKPIVKGSRYKGETNHNEFVLFPYIYDGHRYRVIDEGVLQKNYPRTYAYLLSYKTELVKRDIDRGAQWYEFGRSQGVQSMHQEKIVLSTLVNGQINFYKLPKDVMVYSGLFIVKNKLDADWELIEQTLQSEEFYRYVRLTGKDFSGGYKSLTSKTIKEFQITQTDSGRLF